MKKLALILLLTLESFAQTLTGLKTGTGAATGTLSNFPLGNLQWSMRFHNLPTTAPASDLILASVTTYSGLQISCKVQGGTLGVTCYSPNGAPGGAALLPLNGATDIRLVYTRLFTATNACQIGGTAGQNCSQERIDFWKGDCSGYQWSNMPIDYNVAEPATTNQPYQIGGSTFVTDFFRADAYPSGGIAATPTCPADAPSHHAANMDFRFEGSSLTDVSGHGYTLTVSGQAFLASPTYNPAAIILTSSTAPRPVVPLAPFTLTSASVTTDSAANANVPSTFSWSQVSGPSATISNASASSTTITPSADGSYVFQLSVTDGSSHTGTAQMNVGVVNSDANGIKIQTNAELGWIIGPIPRFGTSPWPWFEQTEATDVDVLAGYWQAVPSPATLFTGTGNNDAFFSGRGPFLGATSDSYDVMIASTGFPDSYEWRKDGGAWSAPIPISQTGTCYSFLPNPLPVTDGVVICFGNSSGHTLGDKWTRMAPQAGTASVTATGANKLNPSTGEIEGVNTGNPCSYLVTAVGTGTLWKTGSPSQRLTANNSYWFEWDYAGDGSNQGRFNANVSNVVDDTHICIGGNGGEWPIPPALGTAMTIQAIDSDTNITQSIDLFSEYTATGQPSSSLNYYNAILGVVRLAQATNLQQYINLAQSSCQNWWQYGLDHGYNIVIPRNAGWHALMACASMFGYNWWGVPVTNSPGSGLAYSLTYSGFFNGLNPTTPSDRDSLPGGLDVRETAFLSRSAAIFAHVYPAHTSSPSTTRATWCGYAANEVTNTWLNPWNPPTTRGLYSLIHSGQDVYWQDGSFGTGNNMSAPNAGTPPGNIENTAMGTSPWRDSGLSNLAMVELYRIMANSTDCSNPSLASTIQTASERAASYIWDYGRSPDGGLYYNSGYLSDGQGWSGTDSIHNKESEYGDVSGNITISGTAVTSSASNSAFIRRFGGGSISQITLNSTNYTVSSVTDNAHMTLATAPAAGSYCPECWSNPATIAVTNGSSTVVGTGTNFLTMFNCNGTDYIGILGNSASFQDNGVYLVSSCADNTHLTLSTPWVGVTNQSAQNDFSWSNAASTNCSPSIGTCEPDEYNGKSLAADWAVSLAQTYQWTQSPTWFSRAQYGLGSLYGGPPAGPAFYQPVSGPQSTLAWGNFDAIIPGCNQTNGVQPCSADGNDGSGHFAKEFGMSAGAGNAPNAIAAYLTPALGGSVTFPLFRRETLRRYTAH